MRNIFILAIAITIFNSFAQTVEQKKTGSTTGSSQHDALKIVNFDQLQSILQKKDNKLYVVNFWATWCKPCVDELPGFMEVNKTYRGNPRFKMILVSLDPATEIDTKVRPFLLKNKIEADVCILDDNKRMNEWIPSIDKKWSGSIPATAIYKNGIKLEFKENMMEKKELVQLINKHL